MNIREVLDKDIGDWSAMRTSLWPDTDDSHRSEIRDYFEGLSIDKVKVYVADIDGRATVHIW